MPLSHLPLTAQGILLYLDWGWRFLALRYAAFSHPCTSTSSSFCCKAKTFGCKILEATPFAFAVTSFPRAIILHDSRSIVHTASLSGLLQCTTWTAVCMRTAVCAADILTTQPHSLNGEKKMPWGNNIVNISKTLYCHLRKLQKEEVPMSLDSYLEVWLAQNIKDECDLPLPALPYPLLSSFITKENLSLPHLSLKEPGILGNKLEAPQVWPVKGLESPVPTRGKHWVLASWDTWASSVLVGELLNANTIQTESLKSDLSSGRFSVPKF